MNGFAIVNYARFLVDAYADPKWNDVTIIDFVNDGIRSLNNVMMAKKSNKLTKKVTLTTVSGTQNYKLDSTGIIADNDYLAPYKLTNAAAAYGVGATIDYRYRPEILEVVAGEQYTHQYPWYYVYNGYIYLGPTPTDAVALDFWYFYSLPLLTLGATPTWMPEIYHPLLSYFAAVRMTAQDKQTTQEVREDYKEKYQEYMDYIFSSRPNEIQYIPAGDSWNY